SRCRLSPNDSGKRPFETNHERTLYVPYVFRKYLILRVQIEEPLQPELNNGASAAGWCCRRKRRANDEAIGLRERYQHGAVLSFRRYGGPLAVTIFFQCGAQVVGPLVIFRQCKPEND